MSVQAGSAGVSPRAWSIIVWSLYLAGFFFFFVTPVIGVIFALVKRGDFPGSPFESHLTSAIRTFWIGLVVGFVGIVLCLVYVGFVLLLALMFWWLFRSIRGLIRALEGRPIDNPTGWF